MNQSENDKIRRIEDYLEFVQADLDKISPEKRGIFVDKTLSSWGVTFGALLSSYGDEKVMLDPLDPNYYQGLVVSDDDWDRIRKFQAVWLSALKGFMDFVEKGVHLITFNAPGYIEWRTGEFLMYFAPWPNPGFTNGRVYDEVAMEEAYNKAYHPQEEFKQFQFDEFIMPPGFIGFIRCLVGFPIESLKRCPHCDRIFFSPNILKKKFCSSKCQRAAAFQRAQARKKSKKSD